MMQNWQITGKSATLCFSSETGAITGWLGPHPNLLKDGGELVSIFLRNSSGTLIRIDGSEFATRTFDGSAFRYENHPAFLGLSLQIDCRTENDVFYFRGHARNIPADFLLELFCAPQLRLPHVREILAPFSDGALFDPAFLPEQQPDRDLNDLWWIYPGRMQMQFIAALNDGFGIYLAAQDPEHAPKRIICLRQNGIYLALENYCAASGNYDAPFESAVTSFAGDWMAAAELYRHWVEMLGQVKKVKYPAWFEDSPVIITYPVCGEGLMGGTPNEFFPYIKALPHLLKIGEQTASRILAHLMRYDQHGPWTPPYVWPPLGGAAGLKELAEELHRHHHLIGVYGSGSAWTTKSVLTGYVAEEPGIEAEMTVLPDGQIAPGGMGGIRDGWHFCLESERLSQIMLEQTAAVADAKIDFYQLFDQDLGGEGALCYSSQHCHPRVPGTHTTTATLALYKAVNAEMAKLNPEMVLGTECAAAEPFLSELPLNDLRPQFPFDRKHRPVPLYQFVFHHYANNFSGNQNLVCNHSGYGKYPDNLLFRTAYGFNAGDLLTLQMRCGGQVDWGAATDWNIPPPNQDEILTLTRNLNAVRRQYPQYLRHGRMRRPECSVTGGKYVFHYDEREYEFDSFFSTEWESETGRRAVILTNFLPHSQTVNRDGKSLILSPLSARVIEL